MTLRGFPAFLLIFLWFVPVWSLIYKLRGEQVQWTPNVTEQPKYFMWTHNDKIVLKVHLTEERVYASYEGRVTLDRQTAQLQISDLRLQDSGKYVFETYFQEKPFQKSYELEVIEKVAKPSIFCHMNSSSKMSAVLFCFEDLNRTAKLAFDWISGEKVQPGPWLTISLGGELNEQQYTCRVRNHLSQENATFTAKDCNPNPVSVSSLSTEVIVVIAVAVVLVCFIRPMITLFLKRTEILAFLRRMNGTNGNDEPDHQLNYEENNQEPPPEAEVVHQVENEPLLEEQPAALPPQPQNQLNNENEPDPEV